MAFNTTDNKLQQKWSLTLLIVYFLLKHITLETYSWLQTSASVIRVKNEMIKMGNCRETATRQNFLLWDKKETLLRPSQFQILFCLSRLPEATVMCFDQCRSGSVGRPAYHRHLPAGFHCQPHVCERTCVRLMVNEWKIPWSGCCGHCCMWYTHWPHAPWVSLVIYLNS